MKKAMISELKDRLSYYLRYVRRGQSILVYDRDRPIARIEPVRESIAGGNEPSHFAELERVGAVRAPATPLRPSWLDERPSINSDAVSALLSERESGR